MTVVQSRVEPTVGAVIVNYNGGDRIIRVVAALLDQDYALTAIVVVDNDSMDGSPARIRAAFPAVQMIELGANTGLSNARNVGLRSLETTFAFIVDHDIYADKHCVGRMVRTCLSTQATVVCPRIRLIPERQIIQVEGAAPHFVGTLILRHGHHRVADTPAIAEAVDGCTGGCMLVNRRLVIDAGGFDDLFFFYFEDLEFSLRLRGMGHHFWCEPTAEVFHEPAAGTPGLSYRGKGRYPGQRAYFTLRNRLLTILIHYRWRTLIVLLPALALYEAASLVVVTRKGWPGQWLRAWWWTLANLGTIRARRRMIHGRRTVPDKDLLRGGVPPLAPGFLTSRLEHRLLYWFSATLNGYWTLTRRWIA